MKKKNSDNLTVGQRRRMAAEKYRRENTDEDIFEELNIVSDVPESTGGVSENKPDENESDWNEEIVPLDFSGELEISSGEADEAVREEKAGKDKKSRKKKGTAKKVVLIILAVICLVAIVSCVAFNKWKKQKIVDFDEETYGEVELDARIDGVYTCLLIAPDKSGMLTDTMMLMVVRTDEKKIDLISLPRDTRVENPNPNSSTKYVKLNSVMMRAPLSKENPDQKFNLNALVSEVRNITGIPINDFLLVDIKVVRDTVDMFGGVWYDVPMDMDYEDEYQDLYIHLKKGHQLIDGDKAEQLLRFRAGYPTADLGRTETQRNFLIEAFKQHAKVGNISKLGEWFEMTKSHIETQMIYEDVLNIAKIVVNDSFELNSVLLPGTTIDGSGDYFYDAEAMNKLARELGFEENVMSTPKPSVSSDSTESFDSDDGPASIVVDEDPGYIEDIEDDEDRDDKPTKSPKPSDDDDEDADDDGRPTKSPKPTDSSKPTKSPKPTDDGDDDEDDNAEKTPKPADEDDDEPSETHEPENTPDRDEPSDDNGGYPDGL